MSTTTGRAGQTARADEAGGSPRGYGWILFAGMMLALVGTLNVIYGIAAIGNSRFYARGVSYVIGDLKTWGWFLVIVGALQMAAAASIWGQTAWGRWVGVATASINLLIQMLVLPGRPFLSLTLVVIDVLVIYGLVAYGGRPSR
jgi:hypothetical protein